MALATASLADAALKFRRFVILVSRQRFGIPLSTLSEFSGPLHNAVKERGRPALLDTDIERAAQEPRYYLDMEEVQRQFWAHWESTGKPEFKKGVAQAFMGFTKRKYGQVKHNKR